MNKILAALTILLSLNAFPAVSQVIYTSGGRIPEIQYIEGNQPSYEETLVELAETEYVKASYEGTEIVNVHGHDITIDQIRDLEREKYEEDWREEHDDRFYIRP